MGNIKSYIDANLIITAVSSTAQPKDKIRAVTVLEDTSRRFIVSDFVKMETLPQMRYNKMREQVEFVEAFLLDADDYVRFSAEIFDKAEEIASTYGLSAMDALHAASAIEAGADELLTFEKPSKPFFRIPPEVLKVVSLYDGSG